MSLFELLLPMKHGAVFAGKVKHDWLLATPIIDTEISHLDRAAGEE